MDIDLLKQQSEELLEFKICEANPYIDLNDVKKLFRYIREFYTKYPPEGIEDDFIVIYTDDKLDSLGLNCKDSMNGKNDDLFSMIEFPAIVKRSSNGKTRVWNNKSINIKDDMKKCYLAYELNNEGEYIWTDGERISIPEPVVFTRSVFATPTFFDLDSALNRYYDSHAKQSVCRLISDSWSCKRRVHWTNGPESNLRDSLWNFLRSGLRGVKSINREQNVSDKNPVDIKIEWSGNVAVALIEIKWLGISVNKDRNITANYTNSRATKGGEQLLDYLIESKNQNPYYYFKGYLIVYDGRRKNVNKTSSLDNLKDQDLWYYKNIDIENMTEEFEKNGCICKRFFMEPPVSKMKFSS